jgi:Asp-tRNA(Asn)/Glu-tRNA(Gln) amidotransferase A subunit family amidase
VKKEFTSREATEALYRRIKEVDGKIGAYLLLTEEEALHQADRVDQKISRGEEIADLAGVPLGLKDILCTKGIRTTCASKILGNYVPFMMGPLSISQREDAVFRKPTWMSRRVLRLKTCGFRKPWT